MSEGVSMSAAPTVTETGDANIVILVGEVTSPFVSRTLNDGSVVSSFDLATVTDEGRHTVPIALVGESHVVTEGALVCVVGVVRRRFFRSGSAVTSRTEVLASTVLSARRKAQVRKSVERALGNLPEELRV
jgi:hypothetical protein